MDLEKYTEGVNWILVDDYRVIMVTSSWDSTKLRKSLNRQLSIVQEALISKKSINWHLK
jgi:hypothetical protein